MIEESIQRDTLAQNVTCHEIDREGARALSSLRISRLNASDQTGVVGIRQVEIQVDAASHGMERLKKQD